MSESGLVGFARACLLACVVGSVVIMVSQGSCGVRWRCLAAVTRRDWALSEYGSKMLVDVEATWRFNDVFRVAIGAENLFDTLPDDDGHFIMELLGVDKAVTSPFGFNGGMYYVRLAADF